MQFYVAAPFSQKEKVRKIYRRIEKEGHFITFDWTHHPSTKPYWKNSQVTMHQAVNDTNGIQLCDVFILISDESAGRGMYIELGMAMILNIIKGTPLIFVIGHYNDNSAFYFHPSIKRKKNIQQVFAHLTRLQL